jgi:hypothetical protein
LNIAYPRSDGEDLRAAPRRAGFWIGDLALFSNQGLIGMAPRLRP